MTLTRICGLVVIAVSALVGFYAIEARAATLLPPGKQTFLDANGKPLSGGTVQFYVPGTTTPKDTYQDAGGTILNANPVILNGAGQAVIFGTGSYRQIVKDSLGNTIWDQITADTAAASTSWAGTSGGTANNQTVNAANFTSSAGQIIGFIAGFTNTGALALNPNGSGGINVVKDTATGPVSLTGGEVVAGNTVQVIYDATLGAFHLVSTPGTGASSANTIRSNLTNTTAQAADNSLTQVLDALAGNAQGSTLYRSGSAWAALAPGTSGQFLKTQGASANPSWDYGNYVRRYYTETTSWSAALTTAIPLDDTVPTSTEGTQVLSVSVVVDNATQIVRLRFSADVTNITGQTYVIASIFQGTTSVATGLVYIETTNIIRPLLVEKEVTPGAAGTYTYSVRVGPNTGSAYLNGSTTARLFGGSMAAVLTADVLR